jgi:hypothetical protein
MKEFGGLGIPDLRDLNICLLAVWIQRYQNSESKLWREIMDTKYHTSPPNIFCCDDRQCSPFLKGFKLATQAAKMGFKWKLGNVRKARFWEDQWVSTCSLAIQFCEIYSIINEQEITVREARWIQH